MIQKKSILVPDRILILKHPKRVLQKHTVILHLLLDPTFDIFT